jgi:hypothetical protein
MPDFKPQTSEAEAIRQNLERLKEAQPERYAELERSFERVRERQANAEALERTKRDLQLAEYAQKRGYRPSPTGSTPGVTVLEHPTSRDRVAVAKTQDGQWIFAALRDYKTPPPREGQAPDLTRERLRDCIARTRDKGSVVEFVQHCERVAGRPEPSVDQVREHLRQWQERQRAIELGARSTAEGRSQGDPLGSPSSPPGGPAIALPERADDRLRISPAPADLRHRIGDWSSSPATLHPSEAEVRERKQRWHDAQRAISLKLARASELAKTQLAPALPSPGDVSRNPGRATFPNPTQRALAQRRYDWSPSASEGGKPLAQTRRRPGPERGR